MRDRLAKKATERAHRPGDLVTDLRRPGVELQETHISWVFLECDDVWKVKKPVDLGFLDFSTPEKRRWACDEEVRLNRRLAPSVYRGVVPITCDRAGRYGFGGSGPAVDWAVHMARLPDDARGDRRLARELLSAGDIERVADHLAVFHAGARCDEETTRYGSVKVISDNVRENFEQTRDIIGAYLSPEQAREIETRQCLFLSRRRDLFAARQTAGRVRDGHGDLRLDHVYLSDAEVTIVDCIEFNRRFRFADVCADVAFLAMDLTWRGRADLAEHFLAAYARQANDYDLYPLVDFYESYRAFVRGKIASMVASDDGIDTLSRRRSAAEARRFFLLALASERRSLLPPVVVAVGGLIGAGKTTVARRLASELTAPVVDADRTRKHLLGVEAEARVHVAPFSGAYRPDFSRDVYSEVLRRAGAVLTSGRPVVLDASFRSRRARVAARQLADDHSVPFRFVECHASPEVCRRRLELRAREANVSDGRLEIFDDFVARWQTVDDLPETEHSIVDTSKPLETNIAALRRRLPTWPAGLKT